MEVKGSNRDSKGSFIKDVRKIFGILDPVPPPCVHFMQPISTVCRPNSEISQPSPLREDILYEWSLMATLGLIG